jgi:hypothetical protein
MTPEPEPDPEAPLLPAQQRILVFQQHGSGEKKIQGILLHGQGRFALNTVAVDGALPPVLDETDDLLPNTLDADLVLDYLVHPDLSHDLAAQCVASGIPVIAPGKKLRMKGVFSPPT